VAFYDGTPYSLIFDRLFCGLHERVAGWVEPGTRALDLCCGSGGLTFQLAGRCREVVGLDLSPRMIARAEVLRRRRGIDHATFQVGDATRLVGLLTGPFDVVTIAMGLHEMPHEARSRVLAEALSVAPRAVIVDFAVPMPRNLAGWRNRAIELAAGPRHFAGFRDYVRRGGLRPLVEAAGARIVRGRPLDSATLSLVEITLDAP
jgi:demethylmenaquinone methyltransferase/2-methoxy-6-polyprenyl-1,4-benzoquinol methylase